jgi:hypothetical protein
MEVPQMPKKKLPNKLRINNRTVKSQTFAYQTGGNGVEARV